MAAFIGTAFVDIRPDMTGFGREVDTRMRGVEGDADRAGASVGTRFGTAMKGAAIAGAALAGAAVVQFIGQSIGAASDLAESTSKVRVVFGDQADAILSWSESAATAFGMSEQAALEASGTYGNLFSAMGVGVDAGAEMSTGLVELAADLASFNNANPEEVLTALQSGLVGEAEPLRRFGVSLSAARIEEEALRMGLAATADELTAGQKAQAAYAIIMADTTNAQGDFARTSDGMANQQRILSAQFEDAKAKLGEKLLPALTAVMQFVTGTVMPNLGRLGDLFRTVFQSEVAQAALLAFQSVTQAVITTVTFLWENFGDSIANIVMATVGILVDTWTAFFGILQGLFDTVMAVLRGDWGAAWDGIKQVVTSVIDFVIGYVRGALTLFAAVGGLLLDVIVTVFSVPFEAAKGIVTGAVGSILSVIGGLPGQVLGLVGAMASAATAVGRAMIEGLMSGIEAVIGGAVSLGQAFIDALRRAWNWLVDQANAAWNAVEFDAPGPIPGTIGLPDNVLRVLRLHEGGIVPGRAGSEAWALLRAGEVVLTPEQMSRAAGPAVAIDTVVMADAVDVDLLVGRLSAAVTAGRL